MSPETLIRMANQIAAFFKAQGTATAPAAIAEHLQSFWDPRMRKAIIALEANGTATGLDPLAAAAVRMLKPVDAAAKVV
ncbi:formate dehydrogenase subunit delta [Chelatococcus asaccharovorans]|uniref:Formate dehydrogenase delta subunit n=1 Tax=Chelatococcus asaccharovorans TaxID=28210 RepID=A0A2V3TX74_9HYPH|nr:formate dehydrogenase subunit delta [Chelatococcus asaccharovorans]MBS7706874.1 formate dehydrogenase subunit delta [Chelatococcus asaccharovorans]PXW53980.1 formate dehydrogenase delta subunit [Chelatococcus asaccharovorans]CAH1654350.1 NAD-dependent formate dehydrogenase delta subunit [Chelatococcus asaccharovorans]CAH1694645.1 NAD-dependent formate dehydrogenase delta subunit [Chelatococcus asaccharovorans]